MDRRSFLKAGGGGVFALIGAGVGVYSQVPVIPSRPTPDLEAAAGWIGYKDGRYRLTVPRAEMGQNIATALKQIACTELEVAWDAVEVALHDTSKAGLKPTVGSESVQLFAEPLAQACAALRDAVAEGQAIGQVTVVARPRSSLRVFQGADLQGADLQGADLQSTDFHGAGTIAMAPENAQVQESTHAAPIAPAPEIAQGRAIVTGQPIFAADVERPGLVYGRVLRAPASTEVRSRPLSWNEAAARAVPGFVAIVKDAGPAIGQATGLGIVAERPGALDAIADALAITWEIGEDHPYADIARAIDIDRRLAQGDLPHVVRDGTPKEGLWDIDLRFDIPAAAHGQIEPRAAVAEARDGRLRLWAGTQDAFYIRDFVADAFGLNPKHVVVQSTRIGGGFGGKTICLVEAEAAALSIAVQLPVKVQWTRAQEYAQAFHRPPSSHRIKARISEGRITDWDHNQLSSHIMFTSAVVPGWMQAGTDLFAGDGGVERGMAVPYRLGRARSAYDAVRLPFHTGPWRGLGAGPNALVTESVIDEAARAAGADPLTFRLAHIDEAPDARLGEGSGEGPSARPDEPLNDKPGTGPDGRRLAGVLRAVGALSNWSETAQSTTRGQTRIGRGLACGVYKDLSFAATVAEVAVDPGGYVQVTRLWCTHECGLVINPDQVKAQCEGNLIWSLGMVLSDHLPTERGRVVAEYFADAPIPRLSDAPEIVVELIHSNAPPVGAGETAMVSAPGAIANAIRAATGQRVVQFPVQPEVLAL